MPSIRKSDAEKGGRGDLIQAVRGNPNKHFARVQTPVKDGAVDRKDGKINSRGEPKLSAQVKRMPTATKSDAHGGPGRGAKKQGGDNLRTEVGGSLNPDWIEWFQGFPIGWTGLAALETVKSPSPLPLHGESFQEWLTTMRASLDNFY